VSSLSEASLAEPSSFAWRYLDGRIPYIGLALLSGFAAQEFMERLKEVAKTLFGIDDRRD
jgi:hypothetical protein